MPKRRPPSSSSDSDDGSDSDDSSYASSGTNSDSESESESWSSSGDSYSDEEDDDMSNSSASASSSRNPIVRKRSVYFAGESDSEPPERTPLLPILTRKSSRISRPATPPLVDRPRLDAAGRVIAPSRHLTALPRQRTYASSPTRSSRSGSPQRSLFDDPTAFAAFIERNVNSYIARRQYAVARHAAMEAAAVDAATITTVAPKLSRRRQRRLTRRLVKDDLKRRQRRLKELDREVHPPLKKNRLTRRQLKEQRERLTLTAAATRERAKKEAAAAAAAADAAKAGRGSKKYPNVVRRVPPEEPPAVVGAGSPHARDRALAEGVLPTLGAGRGRVV